MITVLEYVIIAFVVVFVIHEIKKLLFFFTIEKWQAYLDYTIDTVFVNTYASKLMTYVANKTMVDKDDQEFISISRSFLHDIQMSLGKIIKVYYFLYTKDGFRTFVLMKLMLKIYTETTKTIISTTVSEQNQKKKKQ